MVHTANEDSAALRANSNESEPEYYGRKYAVHNPHGKPLSELPTIWGFNNGGSTGWYTAELLADSGHFLGSHVCSSEGFMRGDLGVLAGHRGDRHETFRKHYPDGYRMDFVEGSPKKHARLMAAYERHLALPKDANTAGNDFAKVEVEFTNDPAKTEENVGKR